MAALPNHMSILSTIPSVDLLGVALAFRARR
jgi:ABC-type proline/glycine betaine transport system permease subunit